MSRGPEGRAVSIVQIPASELKRRLDEGTPVALLDVREPFERDLCKIAVNGSSADLFIPMGEIPIRLDEIEDQTRGLPLVVYCHHGVRSLMAARWLAARGFTCGNLAGGIDAWADEVEPGMAKY